MASPSPSNKEGNRFTISSLLSPPEMKRRDSFSLPNAASMARTPQSSFNNESTLPSVRPAAEKKGLPPSPPVSPWQSSHRDNISECDGAEVIVRDPPLFAGSDDCQTVGSNDPLFPQESQSQDVENIISQHIANSAARFPRGVAPPSRDDYRLITFTSKVCQLYNKDPRAYRARMLDEMNQYYSKSRIAPGKKPLRTLAPAPSGGIRKPKAVSTIPRIPRVQRTQKRSPPSRFFDSFEPLAVKPVSPKPPRQPTARDDTDYNSLVNYAPDPWATLPEGNNKVLKAEWKGAMLDLSQDPDRHLLHPAELNLAATLRLSCATYLCSKRRLFDARVNCLKIGKEFRKTDAQMACKIDVNKASKLWTAFEKVGWFSPEYFYQHLRN